MVALLKRDNTLVRGGASSSSMSSIVTKNLTAFPEMPSERYCLTEIKFPRQTAAEEGLGLTYNPNMWIAESEAVDFSPVDPEWVGALARRILIEANAKGQKASEYPYGDWEVPVGLLTTTKGQRTIEDRKAEEWIKKVRRKGWDIKKTGVLTLNIRNDEQGRPIISVIDGLGRSTMALRYFGPNYVLKAIVYIGIPRREETDLFLLQAEDSRRVSLLDTYNAKLDAGDEKALALQQMIHNLGLNVDTKGKNNKALNEITGVDALMRVYDTYGPDVAYDALRALRDAYGHTRGAYTANAIGGLADFLWTFRDAPQFRWSHLMKALEKFTNVSAITNAANEKFSGVQRALKIGWFVHWKYNTTTTKADYRLMMYPERYNIVAAASGRQLMSETVRAAILAGWAKKNK